MMVIVKRSELIPGGRVAALDVEVEQEVETRGTAESLPEAEGVVANGTSGVLTITTTDVEGGAMTIADVIATAGCLLVI